MKILIVESRYYEEIAEQLLTGAKQAIYLASLERSETSGGEAITCDVVTVAGALEIPAAIKFCFPLETFLFEGEKKPAETAIISTPATIPSTPQAFLRNLRLEVAGSGVVGCGLRVAGVWVLCLSFPLIFYILNKLIYFST